MITKNEKLQNEIRELKKRKTSTTNNYITNNFTVNIIPYGEEKQMKPGSVQPLLNDPTTAPSKFINMYYFEDRIPSMRIVNKKETLMDIYKRDLDGKCDWEKVDKRKHIADLYDFACNALETMNNIIK